MERTICSLTEQFSAQYSVVRNRSRSGTPSSIDSFNSMSTEVDEAPYMHVVQPEAPYMHVVQPPEPPTIKRVYKPGESLLRITNPTVSTSTRYTPNPTGVLDYSKTGTAAGRYSSAATTTHSSSSSSSRGHVTSFTPQRCAAGGAAPMFSPTSKYKRASSLPSPITTRDVSFKADESGLFSPMSVKCEDEGPTMDMSPMQHDQSLGFAAVCEADDNLQIPLPDAENPFDPMSIL